MGKEDKREFLKNMEDKIGVLDSEQKSYLLGYMEGICQASEKNRKEEQKCEV